MCLPRRNVGGTFHKHDVVYRQTQAFSRARFLPSPRAATLFFDCDIKRAASVKKRRRALARKLLFRIVLYLFRKNGEKGSAEQSSRLLSFYVVNVTAQIAPAALYSRINLGARAKFFQRKYNFTRTRGVFARCCLLRVFRLRD